MLHKERIKKLTDELNKSGADAIFLGPSSDLEYLVELKLFPDARTKGLMVSKSGEIFALTPLLYSEDMEATLGKDVQYLIWADHEGFQSAFKKGCQTMKLEGMRVAINAGVSAVDLLEMMTCLPAQFINGKRMLDPIRSRKDEKEMDLMRQSSQIADKCMMRVKDYLRVGILEKELAEQIKTFFHEEGAEELSFAPIVASGPNGSMPHYSGSNREIQKGDFVVVDMGGRYKEYCSDITRTFCMGEPTDEQRHVYHIVLEAQKAGEAAVSSKSTGQDVDRAARKVIVDAGYGNNFLNRVGHGIGIAVHESPYIIEGNDVPLSSGNIFSIEPGIYLPGKFGVRIENLVAITENGGKEVLNKFPRDLIVIDR